MALVVFAYLAILRTRHITEMSELLGDQILYWDIALRPWSDLPLGGGPSSVGGTTLARLSGTPYGSADASNAVHGQTASTR